MEYVLIFIDLSKGLELRVLHHPAPEEIGSLEGNPGERVWKKAQTLLFPGGKISFFKLYLQIGNLIKYLC